MSGFHKNYGGQQGQTQRTSPGGARRTMSSLATGSAGSRHGQSYDPRRQTPAPPTNATGYCQVPRTNATAYTQVPPTNSQQTTYQQNTSQMVTPFGCQNYASINPYSINQNAYQAQIATDTWNFPPAAQLSDAYFNTSVLSSSYGQTQQAAQRSTPITNAQQLRAGAGISRSLPSAQQSQT